MWSFKRREGQIRRPVLGWVVVLMCCGSGLRSAWASERVPTGVLRWMPELERAGRVHGVDPELLASMAFVESGGDPHARSPAGALGLMQVMPTTARDIARRRGVEPVPTASLEDPAINVDLGAYYLATMLRAFRGDVEVALAAYNAGPGRVRRHLDDGVPLPVETVRYVERIGALWRHDGEPLDGVLVEHEVVGSPRVIVSGQLSRVFGVTWSGREVSMEGEWIPGVSGSMDGWEPCGSPGEAHGVAPAPEVGDRCRDILVTRAFL